MWTKCREKIITQVFSFYLNLRQEWQSSFEFLSDNVYLSAQFMIEISVWFVYISPIYIHIFAHILPRIFHSVYIFLFPLFFLSFFSVSYLSCFSILYFIYQTYNNFFLFVFCLFFSPNFFVHQISILKCTSSFLKFRDSFSPSLWLNPPFPPPSLSLYLSYSSLTIILCLLIQWQKECRERKELAHAVKRIFIPVERERRNYACTLALTSSSPWGERVGCSHRVLEARRDETERTE